MGKPYPFCFFNATPNGLKKKGPRKKDRIPLIIAKIFLEEPENDWVRAVDLTSKMFQFIEGTNGFVGSIS
jgi:hypothetical protein